MDTQAIEVQVNRVCPSATIDDMSQARLMVDSLKRIAREFGDELDRRMLEYVQEHGAVEIGTIKYFAGTKKKTKCRDISAALQALFESNGGDFGSVAQFLSSEPIKYGACKDLLGVAWHSHFEVIEEAELKEGVVKKTLQKIDTKFIR